MNKINEILVILLSNNKNKKYTAVILNDKNKKIKIDFGSKNSKTFLDHNDENKRYNYFLRHYNNPNEKYYIDNLIISPSLLSLFILWNNKGDIINNVKYLNMVLKNHKKFSLDMLGF
jgi:hypothetical protein